MVQVIQMPLSQNEIGKQVLAQALGEGLGNFTGNYFASKSLNEVLQDPKLKNAPLSERMSALEGALRPYGERGQKLLQSRMQIEQQVEQRKQFEREQEEQKIIGEFASGKPLTPEQFAKMTPENQFKAINIQKNKVASKRFGENLREMGFDDKEINSYQNAFENATEGGKTEIIKQVMDQYNRKKSLDQNKNSENEYPPVNEFEGLNPKEKVSRQNELRKENFPLFKDSQKKLRGLKSEKDHLNILDSLNESHKLPEGFGRGIINPSTKKPYEMAELTGQVNPETQRFIKTLNDFTTQAKDSYGARVTNFDLNQFMERLPSLLNTYEGRRQIIRQMSIINELNSLYEGELKNVYQKYGMGNISYENAVSIVEKNIAPEEERLTKEFDKISENQDQIKSKTKENIQEGMIKVKSPNGQLGSIPKENLDKAKKAGYVIVE